MARIETVGGEPKVIKLPPAITLYPRSYLGEPKEWGKAFPPATTLSPRVRIGSLPHRKEPVK